jgi:hypothetical protein
MMWKSFRRCEQGSSAAERLILPFLVVLMFGGRAWILFLFAAPGRQGVRMVLATQAGKASLR